MKQNSYLSEVGEGLIIQTVYDAFSELVKTYPEGSANYANTASMLRNAIYNSEAFLNNTQALNDLWLSGNNTLINIADNLYAISETLTADAKTLNYRYNLYPQGVYLDFAAGDITDATKTKLATDVHMLAMTILDSLYKEKFPHIHRTLTTETSKKCDKVFL